MVRPKGAADNTFPQDIYLPHLHSHRDAFLCIVHYSTVIETLSVSDTNPEIDTQVMKFF